MLVLLAFVKGTNMNSKNLKLYQRVQKSYRGIVITIVCVIIFVIFTTVTNYVAFRDQLIEKGTRTTHGNCQINVKTSRRFYE